MRAVVLWLLRLVGVDVACAAAVPGLRGPCGFGHLGGGV